MRKSKVFYGWVVVGCVHLLLFTIFSVAYSFSSFFGALQNEFHANRGATSFAFAIAIFLYFVVGVLAGMVSDRTHVRWVTGFGILALALGMWQIGRAHV